MDWRELREWFKTAGIVGAVITGSVAILQYRVNLEAEKRMHQTSEAEIDVRLASAFGELLREANGRSAQQLSEKCVEKLFDKGVSGKDFTDLEKSVASGDQSSITSKLQSCMIPTPVSTASVNAAITSIRVLGNRYPDILGEPAREGLEALAKPLAVNDSTAQAAKKELEKLRTPSDGSTTNP